MFDFRISNHRQTSDIVNLLGEKIISGDVTVDARSILVHATGALRRGAPIGSTPGRGRAGRKDTGSGTERRGRAGRDEIAGRERCCKVAGCLG